MTFVVFHTSPRARESCQVCQVWEVQISPTYRPKTYFTIQAEKIVSPTTRYLGFYCIFISKYFRKMPEISPNYEMGNSIAHLATLSHASFWYVFVRTIPPTYEQARKEEEKRRRVRNKPTPALFALLPLVLFNASRAVYNNFKSFTFMTRVPPSARFLQRSCKKKRNKRGRRWKRMHILVLPGTSKQSGWSLCARCPQATFFLASAMRINPLKRREKRGKRSPYLCAHTWSRCA